MVTRVFMSNDLPLPDTLVRLIEAGVWPSAGAAVWAQQLRPIVPRERVAQFAPEETLICLQPPPFRTLAREAAGGGSGDFWPRCGALHQVVPELALIIGDFGPGSDSPIVLDYALNAACPRVLRLRWTGNGHDVASNWVEGAASFDEFAAMLGLTPGDA
jgi:hypothetical protein